ncbi:MAG: aminopeptidase P N-terminal domain-containing protein, partial [Bacteroidota bacterium]
MQERCYFYQVATFFVGQKSRFLLLIGLWTVLSTAAQETPELPLSPIPAEDLPSAYRYDKDLLTPEFHRGRREALRELLPDSAVAVFFANPVRNRSNDVDYEYHQDPNFYYLSGLREPHAMLMVFKEPVTIDSVVTNELIFVRPRNTVAESWSGRRLGLDGVRQVLQVATVRSNNDFAGMAFDVSTFNKVFYLAPQDDVRDNPFHRGDLFSLVKHFRARLGDKDDPKSGEALKEFMARLRQNKQPEELQLMVQAINFTCQAQKALMRAITPGMPEYEAEAIIEYTFKKNGAEHEGFPSILGGGENSCILHYTANRKPLKNRDLLVCDVGAEYHGYTADVTRTIPVDGTFSEQEKAIYQLVLDAQLAGIEAARQG